MCHDIAPSSEKCTCVKWFQHSWSLTFLAACFHRLTLNCLFVPLICGGNDLGHKCSWNESIILSLYVGDKLNKWKTVEDFHQQHIKWLKNSTHYEVIMLFMWQTLLHGKCIKRAMCMLIRWTTLLLSYSNALGGKTSYVVSSY